MATIRKLRSPWFVVTLLLPTVGGAYVGSYFAVSELDGTLAVRTTYPIVCERRTFRHAWMYDFYAPIGYVEIKLRGETVFVNRRQYGDPVGFCRPFSVTAPGHFWYNHLGMDTVRHLRSPWIIVVGLLVSYVLHSRYRRRLVRPPGIEK